MKKIVTHNGPFHADDAMGVAIVEVAFADAITRLDRSRNSDVIEDADIAVDVGNEYNPAEGRFDHHQVEPSELTRKNGVPLAAAGLVWGEFAEMICAPYEAPTVDLAERVDKKLIQGIDALDTGWDSPGGEVEHLTLSGLIAYMRPAHGEPQDMDSAFWVATQWCKSVLDRVLIHANEELVARESVEEARRVSIGEGYTAAILDEFRPWKEAIHESDPEEMPAFFVYPQGGTWMVMQTPRGMEGDEKFKPYHFRFPDGIRGLRDNELQEATGVTDAVFIHANGFCGGAESMEGAIELAEYAAMNR